MKIEFKYESWQQAIERLVAEEDRRSGRRVTEVMLDIASFADLLKEVCPRYFLSDPLPMRQRVVQVAIPEPLHVRSHPHECLVQRPRVIAVRCL